MKLSVVNIFTFWLVKYFAFYVLMMFKNNNFTLIKLNEIKDCESLFYYLWIFLFLPIVTTILFSAPIYFSFKVKFVGYFLLIIGVTLTLEYILYTWLASQSDYVNGLLNLLISIIFLFIFFRRNASFSKNII